MLAIKEKKKEGKGYFLRIGLLMMNLFFIMLIVQGICCLQDADKNGAFQMENRIGEQYIICLTEQMQGVLEIIILAFCFAVIAIGCMFFHILFNKMPERKQLENLLQCIGYRPIQIFWYEFCYIVFDCVVSYIGAFVLICGSLKYIEGTKIGNVIKEVFKLDYLLHYPVLLVMAVGLFVFVIFRMVKKNTKFTMDSMKSHKRNKKVLKLSRPASLPHINV